LAAFLLCAYLFVWSLGTEPTIGDEARHYRRAVDYFEAPLPHFRVTHDPAYSPSGPGSIVYYDTSLWHEGLALIWKAVGRVSTPLAQGYHLLFFFGLVVFTSLAGRELFGRRGGLWGAAVMATIPINLLLATVFYMEIPMLMFIAAAVYFLLRRKPVLLGIALGGAYLVKAPTAMVLIVPLLVATLVKIGDTWRQRLLRMGLVVAAMIVVTLPDMSWHLKNFGTPIMFRNYTSVYYPKVITDDLVKLPTLGTSAVPLSLYDPEVVAKMFGPTGLVALLVGIVMMVRGLFECLKEGVAAWWREGAGAAARALASPGLAYAWVLSLPLLFYLVAFAVLLPGAYDIRYLQPLTLFGSLALGGWVGRLGVLRYEGRRKWLVRGMGWLLIAAIVGQALAVPAVVHRRRQLDPEIETAFRWIRKHTPKDSRILYLEENLMAMTGRPIVWVAAVPRYLFSADEAHQVAVLKFVNASYIAVHPTRRCDTSPVTREPMAYPRDWLRTLPGRPYLERVYPPGDLPDTEGRFVLYRIDYSKVPPEWLKALDRWPEYP
jgi:hypothetical protein